MSATDETTIGGDGSTTNRPLARGALVGRYVVLARQGAGGMGVVYAAYDPELDRKVALKLLHGEARSSVHPTEGSRRLLREAQAMAKLSHPNVITVHDVGTHGERVFLAMEFVEGETLGTWLASGRSWREALNVFLQAGRGLAAAHAAGIVHRDFKPDNVMVGAADARVRVMDFGLARAARESVHPERSRPEGLAGSKDALLSELTQEGSVVGTPAYMAPEQHLGLEVDGTTDQFSFCTALWEGLYGERPFGGETLAALAFNVTQGKLRDVPRKVQVPAWVRPLLERGLSVKSTERWPDLATLLHALARGAERRRRRVVAVGGFAALLTALGAFGGWQLELERRREACRSDAEDIAEVWNDASESRLREALMGTGISYAESALAYTVPYFAAYVADWRTRYRELCEATTVEGTRTDELWMAARQCLAQRRGGLAALVEVVGENPDATTVQRIVLAAAGLARLEPCSDQDWLGRHPGRPEDEAAASTDDLHRGLWRADALGAAGRPGAGLTLAQELVEATSESQDVLLRARIRKVAGVLAEKAGAYAQGRDLLGQAFDLALATGDDDLAFEAATALVFTVGHRMGEHAEGHLWGRVARALKARLGGELEQGAAGLQISLGSLYKSEGRYAEAERALEQALAIWQQVLGPVHPHVATSHNNLGTLYDAQGRFAEAERAHSQALAIREKVLGPEHPSVAASDNNLGTLYKSQGRDVDAEREYGRALAIWQRALGANHTYVAMARGNLGNLYMRLGRYSDAEQQHSEALAVFQRALGPNHPHVASVRDNLGLVYQMQGRDAEAERMHADALTIREKALGPNHPDLATSHGNLGAVYESQGRFAEAEREYGRALAIREEALGSDHEDVVALLVALGSAKLARGRANEAIRFAERALAIRTRADAETAALAEARFLLARALWATGVDRARAWAVGVAARDGYASARGGHENALAEVEQWLAKRGGAK